LAFLFADYAETTISGKAVIAGVFDRIVWQPEATPTFYVYVRLAQAADLPVIITVLDPKGVKLGDMTLKKPDDVQITARPVYMQVATRVGLPVTEPGLYWFSVDYDGIQLGLVPLQIEPASEDDNGIPISK
jgi:hypothetical protein